MGKAKAKSKVKTKVKAKVKVGIKAPNSGSPGGKKETPVGKPPKWIRMLISCANQYRGYSPGDMLSVPHDVSVNTARSWIASGAAEEVPGPEQQPETKVEESAEAPKVEDLEASKVEEPEVKEAPEENPAENQEDALAEAPPESEEAPAESEEKK